MKNKIKKIFKGLKKDFKRGDHNFSLLLMVIALLLVFTSVRLVQLASADKVLKQQQQQTLAQLDNFADIQDLLGQQIQAITSLSQSELESLRQQTDDRIADARDALENARINLEDKIELQSSVIRTVINRWRVRVPQIKCTFNAGEIDNLKITTSSGSGTFFEIDGKLTIFSNRHVLVEDDRTLNNCEVTFPKEDVTFSFNQSNIQLSEGEKIDLGKITINESPQYSTSRFADSSEMCKNKAAIGDSIVILGYPTIGSDNDITATEGIISGYQGNFYITSAKVERGNSGGAAIWVEENCYLGIPTFTTAGRAESLARILDINTI